MGEWTGFSPITVPSRPCPVLKRSLVHPSVLDTDFFSVISPIAVVCVLRSFLFLKCTRLKGVAAMAACSLPGNVSFPRRAACVCRQVCV